MKEIWLSKKTLFDIDLLQNRAELDGFCYGSLLNKEPKEYLRLFNSEVDEN